MSAAVGGVHVATAEVKAVEIAMFAGQLKKAGASVSTAHRLTGCGQVAGCGFARVKPKPPVLPLLSVNCPLAPKVVAF